MINKSKLNILFKQSCGSCVLSSYAIVSNYFTGIPIGQFFEDYCGHFGLHYRSGEEAERKYAEHFDNEWRNRNCKGYEIILDLHNDSMRQAFLRSRQLFSGFFYLNSNNFVAELEIQLKTEEAFLNITYEPGRDYHSVTVFNDGERFCLRDTNTIILNTISTINQLGSLRDGVLYKRIKPV